MKKISKCVPYVVVNSIWIQQISGQELRLEESCELFLECCRAELTHVFSSSPIQNVMCVNSQGWFKGLRLDGSSVRRVARSAEAELGVSLSIARSQGQDLSYLKNDKLLEASAKSLWHNGSINPACSRNSWCSPGVFDVLKQLSMLPPDATSILQTI
jgi:hypothetical protein